MSLIRPNCPNTMRVGTEKGDVWKSFTIGGPGGEGWPCLSPDHLGAVPSSGGRSTGWALEDGCRSLRVCGACMSESQGQRAGRRAGGWGEVSLDGRPV